MEVVVGLFLVLFRLPVGLLQGNVLQVVPLEEHLPAFDVDLLGDPVEHRAICRATYGGEVDGHLGVDGYQRRVLGGDEELVVVPLVAVACPEAGYLAVGMVKDHVLALAGAGVMALPPSKHRLPFVGLHLEVERVLFVVALQGMKPHRLTAVVDNQRGILTGPARPGFFLRGDEDVTGGRTASLRPYLEDWRPELRTRTEGPRLLPPCRRSDSPGPRAPLTAQGASQHDPSATGSHSLKESSSRDLRAQSLVPHSLPCSPVAHHTEGLDFSRNRGYPASVALFTRVMEMPWMPRPLRRRTVPVRPNLSASGRLSGSG